MLMGALLVGTFQILPNEYATSSGPQTDHLLWSIDSFSSQTTDCAPLDWVSSLKCSKKYVEAGLNILLLCRSHFALSVSGDLLSGCTGSCETFGNGPLVK